MGVDVALVSRLVGEQFPQWAGLPVTPVENDGHDNDTFRLGDDMSVRLPSGSFYAAQVRKEQTWLPVLTPQLPITIPRPLAMGTPTAEFLWPWSIYQWLIGDDATPDSITDLALFAGDLALFLNALRSIDVSHAPRAGMHNFFRGGWLATYDGETRDAIDVLRGEIEAGLITEIWDVALASSWESAPVWVHGDMVVGNLLVSEGRLSAVIDFGCSAVGDPACDLVIAWTLFATPSRNVFRQTLSLDAGTWNRGRGWALWKALIEIRGLRKSAPAMAERPRRVLARIIDEYSNDQAT